MTLKGVKFHN